MMRARCGAGLVERLLAGLGLCAVLLPALLLICALGELLRQAVGGLDCSFLLGLPARQAQHAGILPGLAGSLVLLALAAFLALPVGIGAAIYLQEYCQQGRFGALVARSIEQVAPVPSVVYGLIGLCLFVRTLGLGRSVIAGAATLAISILPAVISSARAALRGVPYSLREACFALGASRWQTLRGVVLPLALPAVFGGATKTLARALGEAAPLIVLGALSQIARAPDALDAPLTALPLQIFNWISHPQNESVINAAAGCLVLLGITLLIQLLGVALERRPRRRLF
ncbi:MAG TPA: phosphate ABC transporter permease PstA [Polyangiaceae bacterium]|nr:phosphate ABC transporter permease PstA [Polyangiaceae bacterium]